MRSDSALWPLAFHLPLAFIAASERIFNLLQRLYLIAYLFYISISFLIVSFPLFQIRNQLLTVFRRIDYDMIACPHLITQYDFRCQGFHMFL